MKAPYVNFMQGIAPRPQADPYVERAIPRKDPDTGEPLDPQGQPLGTDMLLDSPRRAQNARVQAQTMREFNLRFRHMDGVQKVFDWRGGRQSTNIRDVRDPAAAEAYNKEVFKKIETDAYKSVAKTALQSFEYDKRMESIAEHQKGQARAIQDAIRQAIEARKK